MSLLNYSEIEKPNQLRGLNSSFGQLLKWVGNKQRFSREIISFFPNSFNSYFEPFLGSGAVLATLASANSVGSDSYRPLIDIFLTLQSSPDLLKSWYADRWNNLMRGNKKVEYEKIKANFNRDPNAADLLFISRSCYGGVVRFRQSDGYISTPVGIHEPISPASFSKRVDNWFERVKYSRFYNQGFEKTMNMAQEGDLIYCDPPYSHSQSILYGAQNFSLEELLQKIRMCKDRGVFVALSIDGTKRSGNMICDLPIPDGLFEREVFIEVGRSMLKRFQMNGKNLEGEKVSDRLLLTY